MEIYCCKFLTNGQTIEQIYNIDLNNEKKISFIDTTDECKIIFTDIDLTYKNYTVSVMFLMIDKQKTFVFNRIDDFRNWIYETFKFKEHRILFEKINNMNKRIKNMEEDFDGNN
mgnify:CR=1 FL=1